MTVSAPTTAQQIIRHADRRPSATALVTLTDHAAETRQHSYHALVSDARHMAERLTSAGVGAGDVVAVDSYPYYEIVVTLLASWLCGAAYLPIDPSAPSDRNSKILGDARPALRVSLTDPANPAQSDVLDRQLLLLEGAGKPTGVGPGTAYIIYTSGTTGIPKGVPISHDNLEALFSATDRYFDFTPHDTWLVAHSLAFDFSVWELWGALCHGGTAVMPDRWTVREPRALASLVRAEQITVLSQTPTAFGALGPALLAAGAHGTLRYVVFGGERLLPGLLADFAGQSSAALYNLYGITEVTVHATIRHVVEQDISANESNIGTLLPGFEGVLIDQDGEEVTGTVAGELLLSGPQVAAGYLHREELTAERFVHRAGRRFYRSGDLVRRSSSGDESLIYVGRTDDQVQIRGHRIELGEVERVALQLPRALSVHVVALDIDGELHLACAYVSSDDLEIDRRSWVRHLRQLIPAYMVPSIFRRVSTFPRTLNGKIDRRALACRLQQPTHSRTRGTRMSRT